MVLDMKQGAMGRADRSGRSREQTPADMTSLRSRLSLALALTSFLPLALAGIAFGHVLDSRGAGGPAPSLVPSIFIVVAILSVVSGWSLGLRVISPIARLEDAARALGQGQTELLLPKGGAREVAAVSQAFAFMRDHLLSHVPDAAWVDEVGPQTPLHDALTGLPNRMLLMDRLDQALAVARRQGITLALLIFDIRGLREVNASIGAMRRDELLRQVAARLKATLRDSDTIARLDGDEFALVAAVSGDVASATVVAEKALRVVQASFIVDEKPLDVSASVGIAVYPEHGEESKTLLRQATAAMSVARRDASGYAVYEPSPSETSGRLRLTAQLRRAIEGNEMVLHYQPQVDTPSGETAWVEALIRWQHPERGWLSPDHFIPLAERSGLIQPLSQWVLNSALCQAYHWRAKGLNIGVAINLSMKNLLNVRLPEIIGEALASHGLAAAALRVEITESTIMADEQRSMEVVSRLSQMGVTLSIDDYGTGYSSLAYLKRLPLNELKIDQSFVRHMATDDDDLTIVRSTIDLGHNLGLRVVAEGVEGSRVLRQLAELGCDAAQGYFFARPMAACELERWVSVRLRSQ